MKTQSDEMRCPKCGRLDLRETGQGVTCRVCGYSLSPGESDKFRLFRLLKEEERESRDRKGNRRV
jgi:ribosomal protein L37AE/L43A